MPKETGQNYTHKPISPLLDLLFKTEVKSLFFNTDKPFLADTPFKKWTAQVFLNEVKFNTVNKDERGRGQRSVVWLKRSQPCLHHLHVLITTFSWWPLSSFSLWIILSPPPTPPPFIFPLINQCDRYLVWLAWGLMAEGRGFASHGGLTLSRGWLCQKWKPPDIPGTHLHLATQLLNSLYGNLRSGSIFVSLWKLHSGADNLCLSQTVT